MKNFKDKKTKEPYLQIKIQTMSTDENKLKLLRNESFIEPVIRNPFVSKIKFTPLDRVKVRIFVLVLVSLSNLSLKHACKNLQMWNRTMMSG